MHAAELFAALDSRARDPRRFERAVAAVRPLLERAARAVIQRHPTLLSAARIELEDLVQELTQKLFRDPPSSRGNAEAVLVGWAKVVARNHLLDLAAKHDRETAIDRAPVISVDRDPERTFDARAAVRQLERCADELNDRQRAAYEMLREDAEISRLEIARRLEIISNEDAEAALVSIDPKSALADRLRRAQANAWAIVSRVRARLAECLDRHGMLALLPGTLAKLRARSAP
jgi:RNA polymerase sigma factor (sigma-70 family)